MTYHIISLQAIRCVLQATFGLSRSQGASNSEYHVHESLAALNISL